MRFKLSLLSAVIALNAVALAGCSGEDGGVADDGGEGSSSATSSTAQENTGAENNNNNGSADSENEEPQETTTEAQPVETEPEETKLEFVDVPEDSFTYHYDAALGGLVVTDYNGSAGRGDDNYHYLPIRVPSVINGDPVKSIQ